MSRPDASPGASGSSPSGIPGRRSPASASAGFGAGAADSDGGRRLCGAGASDSGPPVGPDALATALAALPPSCGPVRLVAVDGHAGSGKTTFAARLSGALGGAPVLHLDDLANHDAFFDWTDRLREQVLTPLSRGRTAHYTPYDWQRGAFPRGPGATSPLPPAPVVLIEGVGAGRRALRPHLACLLWMDMGPREAWLRGRKRDGPDLAEFWDRWTTAEMAHFTEDSSYSSANFLVHQGELGFQVRKGPEGSR